MTRLGFLALLVSLCGCQSGWMSTWSVWPFERADRTSYVLPSERTNRLRRVAQQFNGANAAQQAQLAQQLASELKTEADPIVRSQIIEALGACPHPSGVAALREGRNDSDSDVRVTCCEVLARRGGADSMAVLHEILSQDQDIDVRLAATRALGDFRQPEAVTSLAVALNDPDPALQYLAVQSLRRVTNRDLGNDVAAWREFLRTGAPPEPQRPTLAERLRRF